MLPAGAMREQITLQAYTATRDAYGGEVITWADQATVWGAVDAITGRESYAAQQLDSVVTLRVRLRMRSDVTTKWRALWRSQVLSIMAVLPSPTRDMITLLCAEGMRDG